MKNDNMIEMYFTSYISFEKELKSKISQKMAPNLTEEQTLIKYFKYFDLDNSGFCAIRDWIKAVEKIGVIIPKPNDLQKLFTHYDSDNKGMINYKQFANALFSNKSNSYNTNYGRSNVKEYIELLYLAIAHERMDLLISYTLTLNQKEESSY